jgi:hypothetical protein
MRPRQQPRYDTVPDLPFAEHNWKMPEIGLKEGGASPDQGLHQSVLSIAAMVHRERITNR